jgi:hypothetical protein
MHTIVTWLSLKDASVWSVFPPFRDDFVYQIFSDLATSLGVILLLCYVRLKQKGRSMKGLALTFVGTALLGSFAPLTFLLIEKDLFE